MSVLCIDIGNTRTHLALVDGFAAHAQHAVFTHEIDDPKKGVGALLDALLAEDEPPRGISFCSVVPLATERLLKVLKDLPLPVFHLTSATCPGLDITYPKPTEIGQDRLANAIGAQARWGAPAVVIDMGTAVTYDVITRAGGYEGGIIAPGLNIMTRYLHEQTALLPELDPNDLAVSAGIGKSTKDAMRLGCSVGFAGMIRALLDLVLTELEKRGELHPRVIATGGSCGNLPRAWIGEIQFEPDLTLQGLAEAFRRHYKTARA